MTNVQKHQPINLVETLYMNRFHSTYYDNYTKKEIENNYISINNRNKDTEENVTSYLTQKKWLQRIGFNDNLFTNMITEMNVDRVFLLSCLISKGYVHQLCNPQLENRLKLNNIIILLAYMIDPNLTEIQLNDDEVGWGDEDEIIEDNKLPELPDSIQKFIKRINKTTESFAKPFIDFDKSYDNYILRFYKLGEYTSENIHKIGDFQLSLFRFLNIVKSMVRQENWTSRWK